MSTIRRPGRREIEAAVRATLRARHLSDREIHAAIAADPDAAPIQTRPGKVIRPIDVAAIRKRTGLSQERFARAVQISPHTLRNWEQRRRMPEGPARALLMAIERNPRAVLEALGEPA